MRVYINYLINTTWYTRYTFLQCYISEHVKLKLKRRKTKNSLAPSASTHVTCLSIPQRGVQTTTIRKGVRNHIKNDIYCKVEYKTPTHQQHNHILSHTLSSNTLCSQHLIITHIQHSRLNHYWLGNKTRNIDSAHMHVVSYYQQLIHSGTGSPCSNLG